MDSTRNFTVYVPLESTPITPFALRAKYLRLLRFHHWSLLYLPLVCACFRDGYDTFKSCAYTSLRSPKYVSTYGSLACMRLKTRREEECDTREYAAVARRG